MCRSHALQLPCHDTALGEWWVGEEGREGEGREGVCAGVTPFNFPAMIPLWVSGEGGRGWCGCGGREEGGGGVCAGGVMIRERN